jgi:peroxiredoxin
MLSRRELWGLFYSALICSSFVGTDVSLYAQQPAVAAEPATADVATTAADVNPVKRGEKAPDARLLTPEGEAVQLNDLYSSAPTVLIFYRGGWCPYCNTHLSKLALIEDELTSAGYQVVAVSPDAPEFLQQTQGKTKANYQLLSDQSADAIKAFGLAFKMPEDLLDTYKSKYQIDLEKWAGGKTHHLLPVPAAYVIKRDGTIVYAHWNADYKQRINNDELLKAALENRD